MNTVKSGSRTSISLINQVLIVHGSDCLYTQITIHTKIRWNTRNQQLYSVTLNGIEIPQEPEYLHQLRNDIRKFSIQQGIDIFYNKLQNDIHEDHQILIVQNKFDLKLYITKVLCKSRKQEENEMIINEISVMQKLEHPNIVALHEVFEDESYYYLVMEKLDRVLDFEYDHDENRLILQQILMGLEHLHRNNIIHRDIKPYNIMFNDDNQIKIIDFGLSKPSLESQNKGILCGTPGYIAPELINEDYEKHKQFPEKCDLFSVGVLMYELYTQEVMIKGESSQEIFENNRTTQYYNIPYIPDGGSELLRGLLESDPFYRFTCQQALAHPYFAHLKDNAPISVPYMEVKLKSNSQNFQKLENSISNSRRTTKDQQSLPNFDIND